MTSPSIVLTILHTALGITLGALVGCVAHYLGLRRRRLPAPVIVYPAPGMDEQLAVLVCPGAQPLVVSAFLAGGPA